MLQEVCQKLASIFTYAGDIQFSAHLNQVNITFSIALLCKAWTVGYIKFSIDMESFTGNIDQSQSAVQVHQ